MEVFCKDTKSLMESKNLSLLDSPEHLCQSETKSRGNSVTENQAYWGGRSMT